MEGSANLDIQVKLTLAQLVDGTENLRSAINHYSDETGVYATLDESNHLVLTAPDGRNIATTTGDGTRLGLELLLVPVFMVGK